ncbi:MAG: hypothetical protein AB7L66_18430 [Gemmatimonadales bacterium]
MAPPPDCAAVGPQCRRLQVRLRVARLAPGDPASGDPEATWLLGHTERVDFGPLAAVGDELQADATIHVPCRYARFAGDAVSCQAHGFQGTVRAPRRPPAPRQLGGNRFAIVSNGSLKPANLPAPPEPKRALAVLASENPCAISPCRTADNTIGAACCRDLQIEIICPPRAARLESLVRTRKSPYLCKVTREHPDSLGAEIISACRYLEPGTPLCSLHGRKRPDGSSAKPDLCFEWPAGAEVYHPGCAFTS